MSRVPDKLAVRATRLTRLAYFGALVAVVAVFGPATSFAQSRPPSGLDVPTTKLLAIGTFTAKGSPDQWKPLLPAEVRDTVRLYLAGKIDQWYLKQDQRVPDHPTRPDRSTPRAFDRACKVVGCC